MIQTTKVTDGPAMDMEQRCVPVQYYPFSYRLSLALQMRGVSVTFEQGLKEGERISSLGHRQLHISEDKSEELASHLESQFGKSIVFSNLWMPPLGKGVIGAIAERAGDVWVRHLILYAPEIDEATSRWDVLVRSNNLGVETATQDWQKPQIGLMALDPRWVTKVTADPNKVQSEADRIWEAVKAAAKG